MVLLENPQQQQQQPNNSLHPLLSPQHLHPNVITTPSNNHNSNNNSNYKDNIHNSSGDPIGPSTTLSLPVTSTIQYPVSKKKIFLKSCDTNQLYKKSGIMLLLLQTMIGIKIRMIYSKR